MIGNSQQLEKNNNDKKKDRLEDCMYRVNMPNRIRSFCTLKGDKRYFAKSRPYCYRRCDRYYNPSGQNNKDKIETFK